MKIGILTFHRCINYGSYWQARCLADGLRQRGHDAVLLDHHSTRINWAEWRCALQPAFPSHRGDHQSYAEKTRRFFGAFAALPLSRPFALERPQEIENCDLIVVGSDEVWNLRHPWYGGYPVFYGEGLRAPRIASYAASFGNYTRDDGLANGWSDKLRRFFAISIRDENSQVLVRRAIEQEPILVLDPCLQFPQAAQATSADPPPPYLAVYGHSFHKWFAEAIRAWAKLQRLRVISIGYRNDWADEQWITIGPEEFATVMAGAEAVATNFFHGCVFALLNQKPFACASSDYRSTKVADLTRNLGAAHHLVTEKSPPTHYERILGTALESQIQQRITMLRRQSNAYLDAVLS